MLKWICWSHVSSMRLQGICLFANFFYPVNFQLRRKEFYWTVGCNLRRKLFCENISGIESYWTHCSGNPYDWVECTINMYMKRITFGFQSLNSFTVQQAKWIVIQWNSTVMLQPRFQKYFSKKGLNLIFSKIHTFKGQKMKSKQ